MSDFFTKLEKAIERNDSLLCVGLDPTPEQLPDRYRAQASNAIDAIVAWNLSLIHI
jgi:uridine monophosphate synthetase